MNTNKVWFITGASKGLGLALVQKLLANNYRVAATSRTINTLKQNIPNFSDSLIYPGYFRTDFLSGDSIKTPQSPIGEYENARQVEQAHLNEINGNQPNDPEKSAEVIIQLSREEKPPVHFFMGEDAYSLAKQKIASLQKALDAFKELTCSTGYKSKITI